jgi:zinc transport system substrate-binding protein
MKRSLCAFCLLLIGGLAAAPAVAAPRLRILTTVYPLREFVSRIAADRADVELLLPPGTGPHTWQPRPSDILRLSRTDLLVAVGAGLEPWLADLIRGVAPARVRLLEVSRGLPLLPLSGGEAEEHDDHGAFDPHVWLDFSLDLRIVDGLAAELAALDGSAAETFRRNAALLKAELEALDARYREALGGCAGRPLLIAGHAAFGYLAARYGLVQQSLYGASPDAQPTPARFVALAESVKRSGARAVFYETALGADAARVLARETGTLALALNAGHNPTRAEQRSLGTFFALMERNLENLRDGLGCR